MPEKPIDNERKACDAVARCLENINSIKRSNAYSPEDQNLDPPVEYVFDLGAKQYALEHTVVEAFDKQIQTNIDFESFIGPIEGALDYKLPSPGAYYLSFSIHPSKGLKPKQIAKVQADIIDWVTKKAIELHAEFPAQPSRLDKPQGLSNKRQATIGGVELVLNRQTGWWMPAKAKGHLFVTRFAPKNYETSRVERLKQAMNKKLPKLNGWRKKGARAILVLENRDMALSNHVAIFAATEDALKGRSDQPDEVWLVDTTIMHEWTVWWLLRDGISFPDEETSARFWDFASDELIEV